MSPDDSKLAESPPVLTRIQARQVDQIAIEQFGIPGIVLMENAGRGCVEHLLDCGVNGPVVVCCGIGNNGGDGFVIARHLVNAGIGVNVVLIGPLDKVSGDAKTNLQIIEKMAVPLVSLQNVENNNWRAELEFVAEQRTEWIVDALLGTGASGPPRPPMDELIEIMNAISAKRMAIDIPTGIDCDSGVCHHPSVRADLTCTFVARKPAFDEPGAKKQAGTVKVIDIGAPQSIIRQILDHENDADR